MIQGNKASGYFVRGIPGGHGETEEGETRQCVHCQDTWVYRPGSGARRGFCMKCMGILCGKPECLRLRNEKHANFRDGNNDPNYVMLPSGVMVPKSDAADIQSRLVA